jgi:hypothetical protein
MAHEHVKADLQVDSQTGRVSLQILATLLGGILLLCSVAAAFLFRDPQLEWGRDFYSATLAVLATVLLGAPTSMVFLRSTFGWQGAGGRRRCAGRSLAARR